MPVTFLGVCRTFAPDPSSTLSRPSRSVYDKPTASTTEPLLGARFSAFRMLNRIGPKKTPSAPSGRAVAPRYLMYQAVEAFVSGHAKCIWSYVNASVFPDTKASTAWYIKYL